MSMPEPALLRRGLVAMQRCAVRLQRSLARLDTFFPIEAGRLQQLAPEHQDDIDAFLKRFEQLVLTLQDQVFIGLAIREGEDPREMSRRDVAEFMERLGAVPSASQFREFVAVRNRLPISTPSIRGGRRQTSTPLRKQRRCLFERASRSRGWSSGRGARRGPREAPRGSGAGRASRQARGSLLSGGPASRRCLR